MKLKREEAEGEGARPKGAVEVNFELCKVCNLNHDQGRKHRYFPNHVRALSSLLSRFHNKLSDIRFFLKNPSPLRPEHAPRNRLWCVFCDADVSELGSSFACSNAIYHLASSEHLKNLKDFLWRHGGGMNRVDSFRVSDADLVKWEKRCEALKDAAPFLCEGTGGGPLIGSSKDIHCELSHNNTDNFPNNSIHCFKPIVSSGVMPLQSLTNEGHPKSNPGVSSDTIVGSIPNYDASFLRMDMRRDMGLQDMHVTGITAERLTAYSGNQMKLLGKDKILVGLSSSSTMDQRTDSGGEWNQGNEANVNSGAPPPWLEEDENYGISPGVNKRLNVNHASSSAWKGKSQKLNPKRVGAAWAEKRRAEMEMEKRGEIFSSSYDANWLPNFGRVWQAGTRKESRKEFEKEKQKFNKVDDQPETSVKIQPYISKRMRLDSG